MRLPCSKEEAMRLARLSEFRRNYFTEESAPSVKTLREKIEKCMLPGGYKDPTGRYWVDLDTYEETVRNAVSGIVDPIVQRAVSNGL